MYTRRFQARITTGHFTLPLAILLSIFCWILSLLLIPVLEVAPNDYPLWSVLADYLPSWGSRALSFLCYGLTGYLLIELNNIYALIRMRASVQTAIYFLLIAVCPAVYPFSTGHIASLAFIWALFFLFRSYQKAHASCELFYLSLCISLGSLAFPQLTLFMPLFWIGAYTFQSLHPKSFFASLIGWGLPYWFLWAHAYYHKQMALFYAPFHELIDFESLTFTFQPWETATGIYLFILFTVSACHSLITGYEDKIKTRSFLQFLIFFTFCLFLYLLLQPAMGTQLLPTLILGTSILAGHLFVLTSSRSTNYFFIGMLIGICLLFGFNIWMLL